MPIKHEWNGTILTITSDSGTSSADLQGVKGATGARGARGLTGRTGGGALIEDGVISTETVWSSSGMMNYFADILKAEGNPLNIEPIPDFPLNITTTFELKQEGSGTASPANIRPIRGFNEINITQSSGSKAYLHTFPLEGIYYSGSLDWNTGRLTVDKLGIECNGMEEWKYYASATYPYFYYDFADYGTVVDGAFICSHFKKTSISSTTNNIGCYIYNASTNNKARISVRTDIASITDLATFKAYLAEQAAANTPIQFVYDLPAPITIELQPQIIKAMKDENTLNTDADNIIVFGRIDTMKTIQELMERVAALEAKVGE